MNKVQRKASRAAIRGGHHLDKQPVGPGSRRAGGNAQLGRAGDKPTLLSVLCVPARVTVATGARLVCASEADRRDTTTVCVLFFKERAALTSL